MNILFDVITDLGRVVKSVFRKKDVDELLQKLHCVSIAEHEADKVKMELRNILFNLEGHDPIAVYHMLKLLQFSDYVADHAENVEGRIRIIVSH
jgi:predicted phosphate transport protein (TIGR00153 family)